MLQNNGNKINNGNKGNNKGNNGRDALCPTALDSPNAVHHTVVDLSIHMGTDACVMETGQGMDSR